MMGRTRGRRGEFVDGRRWGRVCAALLASLSMVTAGCSGGIVNTDDARPTTKASTSAPPPLPAPPNNDKLANAFDFAAQQDGRTGYYFTSPSKRWVCAIIPRETASCQSASGSTISVVGAPGVVLDAQGTEIVPNAISVGIDTDAQFVALDPPGYSLVPGPATVLPFDKVLIVAGFRCNVQESTGVSCASEVTGKGFTFSAEGFTLRYSDLPA